MGVWLLCSRTNWMLWLNVGPLYYHLFFWVVVIICLNMFVGKLCLALHPCHWLGQAAWAKRMLWYKGNASALVTIGHSCCCVQLFYWTPTMQTPTSPVQGTTLVSILHLSISQLIAYWCAGQLLSNYIQAHVTDRVGGCVHKTKKRATER